MHRELRELMKEAKIEILLQRVPEHSKPAMNYKLKTGHYEEARIRHVVSMIPCLRHQARTDCPLSVCRLSFRRLAASFCRSRAAPFAIRHASYQTSMVHQNAAELKTGFTDRLPLYGASSRIPPAYYMARASGH